MEFRYRGFEQNDNIRTYKFDGLTKGEPVLQLVVTADLRLFQKHHVGFQEGPGLCARKLIAGLDTLENHSHELTNDDFLAFAGARAAGEARRAAARRASFRARHAGPAA
ncbi:MAG: hypothetical protein IT158_03725 [Bryobacterales bacterium]|nr:hypothetical protein [Bryobacterales bacterium]